MVFVTTLVPMPVLGRAGDALAPLHATTVSRRDFIRSTVQALDLPLKEKLEVPWKRVPASYLPYAQTAFARGALTVFPENAILTDPITRIEASELLVKLLRRPQIARKATYTDIEAGSFAEIAAQIAVTEGWIKPVRTTFFGAKDTLTGKEARAMLRIAAPEESGVERDRTIRIPIYRINEGKAKKALAKQDLLQTIWNRLNEQYLYQDKLKPDEASYRAIEGLVNSLSDPYTTFMRPSTAKEYQTQLQGEVTGIGAQVELKSGVLVIVSPLRGSPAEKAGLLAGDEILAVDGESLEGMGLEEAVSKVRGPKGSTAKLTIRRDGSELEISVVRDTIRIPEIEIDMQNNITIVKLHQFGQTTDRDLRTLLEATQEKNPKGIILDLRNNPGGLLHAAGTVLSNFLPKGSVIAQIKAKDETYNEVTEDEPTINAAIPMVVLVNKGSASASEIVAGALQDAKRARVVGETTFGKGTVQQIIQFSDGSSLKMTIAEWLTPNGRKIDGVGVTPDILVEKGDRDEQLLKALELLR